MGKLPPGHYSKLSGMDSLAFLHGAFHWIVVSTLSNYSVVSFSISNEVYGEILLSERIHNIFKIASVESGFSVLGGLLCAYCTYRMEGTFKLWVMKNYGVKKSWTGLFTIQETHLHKVIPKYMFADGEVLLLFHDEYENCGFWTSKGPFELWPRSPSFQQGFIFTESLISPKLLI
ncbi:uncharacterized protein LOC132061058 [Lycium ferocissimum]|uniref:uncharacterized protein LOC132061058 n=1 Tax=Lycium ferocissimum TaxID=112874 RepID=UPI002815031C|nr:uncharacterized protein LOC132061058 [Lycium ferocissimum]